MQTPSCYRYRRRWSGSSSSSSKRTIRITLRRSGTTLTPEGSSPARRLWVSISALNRIRSTRQTVAGLLTSALFCLRRREKMLHRVMCAPRSVWFAFCVIALVVGQPPGNKISGSNAGEPCQPDKLTVYKMVLHTFWSREAFPKHYPDWRPPAQWSKVFGEFMFCLWTFSTCDPNEKSKTLYWSWKINH